MKKDAMPEVLESAKLIEDAVHRAIDPRAAVSVKLDGDERRSRWRVRVDVRSEVFEGTNTTKRASMIARAIEDCLRPIYSRHKIKSAEYLLFGLTPEDPDVPDFPPLSSK